MNGANCSARYFPVLTRFNCIAMQPEVIRDFLHMFLINGDCTIKWLANKKIVDSRLPNILMKAYAEKVSYLKVISLLA